MDSIENSDGSVEDLIKQFRSFYFKAHREIFYMVVCQFWLESKVRYKGKKRKRKGNGYANDGTFSLFLKKRVGISQKPVCSFYCFPIIASYLPDFFPEFLCHNPFEEPEYYKYPFKHVTLDHLVYVHKCDERMEMLRYADEKEFSHYDFLNWATNHVMCYNDEVGIEKYSITSSTYLWPHIKNKNKGPGLNNFKRCKKKIEN